MQRSIPYIYPCILCFSWHRFFRAFQIICWLNSPKKTGKHARHGNFQEVVFIPEYECWLIKISAPLRQNPLLWNPTPHPVPLNLRAERKHLSGEKHNYNRYIITQCDSAVRNRESPQINLFGQALRSSLPDVLSYHRGCEQSQIWGWTSQQHRHRWSWPLPHTVDPRLPHAPLETPPQAAHQWWVTILGFNPARPRPVSTS